MSWLGVRDGIRNSKVKALPMEFVPGAKSSYNQTGFLMLKVIIEKTSGGSFETFLATRIFEPLMMRSVRWGDSQEMIAKRVELYHRWVRGPDGRRVVSPDHVSRDSSTYPGYELAKMIETQSLGAVRLNVASLYPLLYRLEKRGWIRGVWVEKEGQRRRRFYRLTPAGRNNLTAQRGVWRSFVAAINRIALPDHG
jgi:PadR family transcriptional regulator PadR